MAARCDLHRRRNDLRQATHEAPIIPFLYGQKTGISSRPLALETRFQNGQPPKRQNTHYHRNGQRHLVLTAADYFLLRERLPCQTFSCTVFRRTGLFPWTVMWNLQNVDIARFSTKAEANWRDKYKTSSILSICQSVLEIFRTMSIF